eukprot:TRINITY_DN2638_c0_g1_i1.p1 TRINITY_DN2638_c0_g1~~TRINITY_DN2638_c0_g1_i1.p1  ORF type:complete len:226 (+),score=-5.53 TRINITY_DN2638_c0_g1_i1:116-793(+)
MTNYTWIGDESVFETNVSTGTPVLLRLAKTRVNNKHLKGFLPSNQLFVFNYRVRLLLGVRTTFSETRYSGFLTPSQLSTQSEAKNPTLRSIPLSKRGSCNNRRTYLNMLNDYVPSRCGVRKGIGQKQRPLYRGDEANTCLQLPNELDHLKDDVKQLKSSIWINKRSKGQLSDRNALMLLKWAIQPQQSSNLKVSLQNSPKHIVLTPNGSLNLQRKTQIFGQRPKT